MINNTNTLKQQEMDMNDLYDAIQNINDEKDFLNFDTTFHKSGFDTTFHKSGNDNDNDETLITYCRKDLSLTKPPSSNDNF